MADTGEGTGRTDGVAEVRSLEEAQHLIAELRERVACREARNEELRSAQARYFDLYDHAPVGYVTMDSQGVILEANLTAAHLLGLDPEGMIGRAITGLVLPEDRGICEMRGRELFESGDGQGCEVRMLREDGSWLWTRLEGVVARDGQDRILCRVAFIDITEQKRSEEALRESEARNRHLQKAESLGRMAGAIAHHFNNKLQTVMANLELLGGAPAGVDPARCLAMAKRATDKAAEVSRLMLLYLGQTTSRKEPMFLAGICRDALPAIRDALPGTVTLETDWPEPGPAISANAGELQRVLINLVDNAWEAMGEKEGPIRIGVSRVKAAEIPAAHRYPAGWQPLDAEYACLEVADTGCGIAHGDIEKLFDPFYSTKFISRGLGLSIVLGIVHAHEGVITVESRRGEYCVIRIYFPLSLETPSLPEKGILDEAPEEGGTVLLVDDDELLLMSTGGLIEILGFELLTARDGVEAVEVFRENRERIRCVITDLTMPKMDGWGTLAALRQIDPEIPVILASGYDEARVLSEPHAERPQVFLGKPFGLQQLQDGLNQALAASSRA